MPQLTRKGAVIHWEERGEGPGLFIAHSMISMPSDFGALLGAARDDRVVTYDPRCWQVKPNEVLMTSRPMPRTWPPSSSRPSGRRRSAWLQPGSARRRHRGRS